MKLPFTECSSFFSGPLSPVYFITPLNAWKHGAYKIQGSVFLFYMTNPILHSFLCTIKLVLFEKRWPTQCFQCQTDETGVMGSQSRPNIRNTWHRILFPHVSENVNWSGSSCFTSVGIAAGTPLFYHVQSPHGKLNFAHTRTFNFLSLKKKEYANISRHYVIAENAWEST